MNENDMDRYYWRMGQRWSGDDRPFKPERAGRKLAHRTILLLGGAFAVTTIMLLLMR